MDILNNMGVSKLSAKVFVFLKWPTPLSNQITFQVTSEVMHKISKSFSNQ